jgi:DNA-binding beta-propeller fold protein YncE
MKRTHFCGVGAVLGLTSLLAMPAAADLVAVAVDNHSVNVNGVSGAPKNPAPDHVALIDTKSSPPKLAATVEAPASVVGAPTSVWIAPDESWLIVTAASKVDPANPDKNINDNRVTVIDLKASPPKATQTVAAGDGANDVTVSPDGSLALVTNRAEGTISIFTVKDKQLTAAGKLELGNAKSLPSSLKFLPDGKTALVALYGENAIGILRIAGSTVTLDKLKLTPGVNPYTLDITADGKLATVGNMGGSAAGEVSTVALIDLTPGKFRTVDVIPVPTSPEGVKFSPDGKTIAVASVDGSTRASDSPIYHDKGQIVMLSVTGMKMKQVAQSTIGRWSQGIAFSKDGKLVLVESMIDRGLNTFRWDGTTLTPNGTIDVKGGAAGIRTAWP